MGIIAVAGGTGGVGQTIVDALVAAGTHKVIVLSRNARSSGNATSLQVDYDNVDSTAKALETENVDTVICAFGMVSDETGEMQVKLIQAASKSTSTRRFVISAFDMLHKKEHIPLNPVAKWTFDAISEIEKTDLEYTRVVNGLFLDYYGMPHWKTHLKPWVTAVNVEKKWAAIPGDGSARAHFITTQDMAKFVARLMDLDKWPPVSSIVGDTATFKEILQLAENARGTKFSVAYDSLEDLQQGKISFPEFPDNDYDYGLSKEEMYAQVHYQAGIEAFLVPTDDTLNSRFPDLKTTTAAEIIESCWKGR